MHAWHDEYGPNPKVNVVLPVLNVEMRRDSRTLKGLNRSSLTHCMLQCNFQQPSPSQDETAFIELRWELEPKCRPREIAASNYLNLFASFSLFSSIGKSEYLFKKFTRKPASLSGMYLD